MHQNSLTQAKQCLRPAVTAMAAMMILVLITFIQPQAFAAETQIDRVTVFGSGTYPATSGGTMTVTQTVNGTPSTVVMASRPGEAGSYSTNSVEFGSNPGTITVNVSIDETLMDSTTNHATVGITINTNSGAASVTGTGASMTNDPATITVDGNSITVPNSGSYSGSAVGSIDDRIIQVCTNAGLQVCVYVFLLSDEPAAVPRERAPFERELRAYIRRNIVRAIRLFTDQLTNVMIMQAMMIGPLLDAKHQLESQQLFGEWQAETHRDYQPSEQVCAFGTLARSMVNAEEGVRENAQAINTILANRELLSGYSASAWGPFADMGARLARYRDIFCEANDNMGQLGNMCNSGASRRKNNDINYYRTLVRRLTLPLDFRDTDLTPEEEDILSLARNLFSHNVLTPIDENLIMPEARFKELQDARMLSAVRSVARNSFSAIVAQRSTGSGLSVDQLRGVLTGLGVPAADINEIIGEEPSYYAQMNVISKKLFQDPQFITNLYVSPANVERTGVALQALQIMHDRQRFEAALRKEMLLSMILEMNLRKAQGRVQDRISKAIK